MKFFLLINIKMPTTVGILIFISRKNFMLNWVEYEKKFYNLGPRLAVLSSDGFVYIYMSLISMECTIMYSTNGNYFYMYTSSTNFSITSALCEQFKTIHICICGTLIVRKILKGKGDLKNASMGKVKCWSFLGHTSFAVSLKLVDT